MAEKVDQDVRGAAIAWLRSTPHGSRHAEADMIERGEYDEHSIVQAFARMKEAGRQQGLREAAEVAGKCPVRYATVRDGRDEWHIECRFKDGQKFASEQSTNRGHESPRTLPHHHTRHPTPGS